MKSQTPKAVKARRDYAAKKYEALGFRVQKSQHSHNRFSFSLIDIDAEKLNTLPEKIQNEFYQKEVFIYGGG